MSETRMRQYVVRMLHKQDAFAVENPAWPGTPDVNYCEGWLELKQISSWPVKDGVVHIDHYTKQQRFFHKERWGVGGNVFLLLQVKREWLLFDGDVAAKEIGFRNRQDLILLARQYWKAGLQRQEFLKCLYR